MLDIPKMFSPINGDLEKYDKKNFSDKVALIDADYLKYLVTSLMYKKIIEEGKDHSVSMLNETIDFYLSRDIFNSFSAKAYVFCFSAPSSNVFRNHLAQEKKYKGNRENQKDSNYYPDKYEDMAYVYEYIKQRHVTLFHDDLEADDLLSFLQHPEKTFIYSNDKDLKQVIGYHFDIKNRFLSYTDEEKGFKMLIKQVLTGDTTDNIPGLFRCGPKRVEEITEGKDAYACLIACINEFISKKDLLHGVDTFVEMWSLVSMKINRGDYFKEKYKSSINLVNSLIEDE